MANTQAVGLGFLIVRRWRGGKMGQPQIGVLPEARAFSPRIDFLMPDTQAVGLGFLSVRRWRGEF
jgi:hypothetical protein